MINWDETTIYYFFYPFILFTSLPLSPLALLVAAGLSVFTLFLSCILHSYRDSEIRDDR